MFAPSRLNQGLEIQRRCGSTLGNKSVLGRVIGHVVEAASDAPETVVPEPFLISIVDDDSSFRDSMRRLLRSHGYTVEVFPSAAEFLASTKLDVTDCLVADIHMPAMTGAELYERLIATGHTIPTILITAHPEERVRQRMLSLGVSSYLHKPLDEAVLMDCLRCAAGRGNNPRGAS
jgi:FixJ family two-component response regulator